MTKREELIVAGARALGEMPLELYDFSLCAETVLDAILSGLREPSEEMVQAGMVAMHNGSAYDDATVDAWQAMLSTLEDQKK